jgi:DNA-binding NtrC family response regulator
MSPASKAILLIAPDLDERRLLMAELREAGYEVLPAPNADYAIRAILLKLIVPSLVLWDEHGSPSATPAERECLSRLTPNVLWMVIESAISTGWREPLGHPAAKVLRRPVRIGQIVEAVRKMIG